VCLAKTQKRERNLAKKRRREEYNRATIPNHDCAFADVFTSDYQCENMSVKTPIWAESQINP
jgi:hypothetical protein